MKQVFKSRDKKIPLPVFFPDATRAVIRTLDTEDIRATKTLGILVNTYHLYTDLGKRVLKKFGGIREFMDWNGGMISDSGGFQVMSIAKTQGGKITDEGVSFKQSKKKKVKLTPETSIEFQMLLKPDMVVVLDDFTMPKATQKQAQDTVDRTVLWAKKCKKRFEEICEKEELDEKDRPYLLGVVQGGDWLKLRKQCAERLLEIGFDGYGYGGWPMKEDGEFNYDVARRIAKDIPKDKHFLYGLGIGKPDEIVNLVDMGYDIFDCVLPTRDARHKRLYVYVAETMDKIDVNQEGFYKYFSPHKQMHYHDDSPVSTACDCLLCTNYSRAYLNHLFKIGDMTAGRLATIHNLRFYSILMEKLREL
ncbi:tRNA-ribosyltransferase family protein [Patescibacteria group bacterium]